MKLNHPFTNTNVQYCNVININEVPVVLLVPIQRCNGVLDSFTNAVNFVTMRYALVGGNLVCHFVQCCSDVIGSKINT